MRQVNRIVLATTNRDKFEEFQLIFALHGEVELLSADQIVRNADKLGFAERYDTYVENASAKARLANMGCHYPTLADDSGLEVESLGGKPGVRSHRYASPKAGVSQDDANNQLLLSELGRERSRNARFVCSLVLCIEGITLQGTGTIDGTILTEPRGGTGFGYDPLFVPKGATKTFAEMTATEKNAISHRARAVQALMEQVKGHGIVFAKP
jgi:XTP/dITP diphosphohydrolase